MLVPGLYLAHQEVTFSLWRARGGDAVTPPLILMRKTDAVRTDDLPNAEWNETNERGEGYGEREYAHFAAAQDWARKNCTRRVG